MVRPLRLTYENATYHITTRGNRRENIFYSDKDKAVFVEKMNETFSKYSFTCYAYCLMDNHYHLFIKTPHAKISEGMHYLNASYTNWFKAEHKIVGVVFQGRYKSILVEIDRHPQLRDKQKLLQSIPGVGEATIHLVLANFANTEKFSNAKRLSAFLGIA